MNKAFTQQDRDAEEDLPEFTLPANTKNYMTPGGWQKMQAELYQLVNKERPELTQMINWAASNGDRSENGDYIYGKRRLREIDRRIRFLTKRLENAEVVDPSTRESEQIFFGATVTYVRENAQAQTQTVSIVGIDETNLQKNYISWISPVARALLKARVGDTVFVHMPSGIEVLDILQVVYQALDT
jgi:transcription elongation factor GreB